MGRYLTGAICLRGHSASSGTEYHAAGKFCETCGAPIIDTCPKCHAAIRGDYHVDGFYGGPAYAAPAYCFNCGEALPWTAEKLAIAKELADEIDNVSADDRAKIKEALDDVARDGPRTQLGAARLKKLLGNASSAVGKAAWKIAIEIATETAKKTLLG